MAVTLTAAHKSRLKPHIASFRRYMKSAAFKNDQEDRQTRVHYLQKELPGRLRALSESDISELVGQLWASRMWGNKQYLVQKVIEDNGLDSLREELRHLLDRKLPPQDRYQRALERIKRLGPASITEILCYSDPEHCGIWNDRSRAAIKSLGLQSFVSPEKYKLSGADYGAFNALLSAIAHELELSGVPDVDLLLVDFFLYEVGEGEKAPAVTEEFDHDEIRDLIDKIGAMLGFDTQTELQIAHGAKVDVVWRARIGNLGLVTYVFEVHKSGSIDSLVLNLQKARSGATVQKVIAVSDQQQLERIEKETEGLPEEFRRSISFWPVGEVQKVGENLRVAMESISRLGLVPGT
jgi:hypothetical protein